MNNTMKTLVIWTAIWLVVGMAIGFVIGRATKKTENPAECTETAQKAEEGSGAITLQLTAQTAQKASTNAVETAIEQEPEQTEEIEAETEPETGAEPEQEEEHEWLTFCATAYTDAPGENGEWGAVDCIYGEPLVDGEHIAADLSVLPYGTRVYIEGIGERTVVDTCDHLDQVNQMAADRDCDGWIDIYMGDRNEDMDDWGIRTVRLYIIEN